VRCNEFEIEFRDASLAFEFGVKGNAKTATNHITQLRDIMRIDSCFFIRYYFRTSM
tara:strand:- start:129 stop:296 length:168 start_codon:yes stop_codon:yes gene_type:complete